VGEHKLKDGQMLELAQVARAIYNNLSDESVAFCERHDLQYEDELQRTVLSMAEAIVFAVIVNHFDPDQHKSAFSALAAGVVGQLRAFAEDPDQFVHRYDS